MRLAAEHALLVRGRAAGMFVEKLVARTRTSTPAACLSFLTVRPRGTSGLSRSWCSSASISPCAISYGDGADLQRGFVGAPGSRARTLIRPPVQAFGTLASRLPPGSASTACESLPVSKIRCCCPVGSGSAALGGIAARSFHRRISVGAGATLNHRRRLLSACD
jgi:hypothetical protein